MVELLPNGDLASFHPQQCVETAAEQEALARTFKAILAKLPEKEFSEAAVFVLNSAKSINKADPRFLRKDFIVSIKPLSGKDPVTLGVEVYQPLEGYLKSLKTLVKAIEDKIERWGEVDAAYSEAVARRVALPEYFVEDPILNKALQGALEDISEGKYTRCVAVDMPHEAAEEIRRYSDFLNKIETGDCMVVVSSGHDTVAEAADSMWQVGSEVIEGLDPVNPGFLRFCDSSGLTEGQVEELLAQERVQEAIQAKAKLLEQLGEHSRLKKLGVPEVLGSEEDK